MSLGITTGVALGGKIRSGRKRGGEIFKETYKAAPLAGVRASFRF